MDISFEINKKMTLEQVRGIYINTNYGKAVEDDIRLQKMIDHTPLVISAWDGETPVGFMRCLTDFEYFCYVSDLLFLPDYQHRGLGKKMMQILKEYLGERVTISLRAEDSAKGFYQQIGLSETNNMFRIRRVD